MCCKFITALSEISFQRIIHVVNQYAWLGQRQKVNMLGVSNYVNKNVSVFWVKYLFIPQFQMKKKIFNKFNSLGRLML